MIDALTNDLINLLLLAALSGAMAGLGLLLLGRTGVTFTTPGSRFFFAFAAGASVTGYAVFALGCAGWLYPAPLAILLAILCVLAVVGWRQAPDLPKPPCKPVGKVETTAAILLALVLGLELILALAPETGRDALVYHLNLPKLFLQNHQFYSVPGCIYANFPLHAEMLYLVGLALHGDVLAKLFHFAALLVLLVGLRELALERIGAQAPVYLALLVFATLPTVFYEGHMAYIDILLAVYVTAAVWAFLHWQDARDRRWLALSAAFVGTAMACKYTALFLPILGVLGVLYAHRKANPGREMLRDLGAFLPLALLFGAPFYIKSWLATGNPVFPFFFPLFGGRGWEPQQAELYEGMLKLYGMGRTPLDYLLLPWNLSFHAEMYSEKFDGIIGPTFLLVLPFLVGLRPLPAWLRTVLAYCGLTFLFWAWGSQQIRLMLPILPFLALALGYIVDRYRARPAIHRLLLVVIAAGVMHNTLLVCGEFYGLRPLGVVLGTETRSAYLSRSVYTYPIFQYVNETLPPDSKLFLVYMENETFLCDRTCYSDTMFEDYTLRKILAQSASPEEVYRALRARGFTHLLFNDAYVLGPKSNLSPQEKTRFVEVLQKYLHPVHQDGPYFLFSL